VFIVTGRFTNGQLYQVQVTGDPAQPVAGSGQIRALVADRTQLGDPIMLSPTGPSVPFNPADGRAVLALLNSTTTVLTVEGDTPKPEPLAVGTIH
jgi:hypothetical protein